MLILAPIAVKILISRGSAYKIATKSGRIFLKTDLFHASKNYRH